MIIYISPKNKHNNKKEYPIILMIKKENPIILIIKRKNPIYNPYTIKPQHIKKEILDKI